MVRLRTMGGLALETGNGADPAEAAGAIALRRRPLALLAILASGGDQGISRDKVLLYLWPESNTPRARNSLHQTLYTIRQQLGSDAIVAGGTTLQLNPTVFSSDLWDFRAALDRSSYEDAVSLYRGPFLDGFTLPGVPEFDHWVEEERTSIARRHADALEAAAAAAMRKGEYRLAIDRWTALARLDPISSRPALGLIRTFMAAGNRARALEHAREYEALIRRELGTAPDATITEVIERLRSEPAAELPAAEPPTIREPAVSAAEQPSSSRASPPRSRRALVALGALVGVVLALALASGRTFLATATRQPTSATLVVVLPFSVSGEAGAEYLESGLVDLLSSKLDGAGKIRAVDPEAALASLAQRGARGGTQEQAEWLAERFGAGLYLTGNVLASGGRLHLQAVMHERRSATPPVRASVEGPAADLFDLVDRLAGQLLAGRYQEPAERLARVAATMTGSIEALKAYLNGERELREGRYVKALDHFQHALNLDSAFALAYYRQAIAAEWTGDDVLARRSAKAATRFGDRLSEHDRRLVAALAAWQDKQYAEAERLYRTVVDDYPESVEGWFHLGEVLFHANPLRGRSAIEARAPFENVLKLDRDDAEALVHLARIAAMEGQRDQVDSLMRRALQLTPNREVLELRAFRAFALGDRSAQKRVTRELLSAPPDVPAVTALQVAVYLDDLEGAEAFARLLRRPSYSSEVRGFGYRLLGRLAAARGRWSEARAQLDSARQFDATAELELRSLLVMLPFLEIPRSELLGVRKALEDWLPAVQDSRQASHSLAHAGLHPAIRLHRLGLLSARLGDSLRALEYARALDRAREPSNPALLRAFAQSIRAGVAIQSGNPEAALEALEAAGWHEVADLCEGEALDRFNRARLLQALGREEEALAWYGSIAQRAAYELVYLAPSQQHQAEIREQMGERPEAVALYRAFVRLWERADPVLQSARTAAQGRIGALGDSS